MEEPKQALVKATLSQERVFYKDRVKVAINQDQDSQLPALKIIMVQANQDAWTLKK